MESSIFIKKAYSDLISHHVDTARAYMLPGTDARPLPAHLEVVLEETRDHIVTVYNIVAFAENKF